MGQNNQQVTGGCMCGAVRYEARGELVSVIHCRCLSCRRHAGSDNASFTFFDGPALPAGFC